MAPAARHDRDRRGLRKHRAKRELRVFRTETATGSEQRFATAVKCGLCREDNFAFRRTNSTDVICGAASATKVGHALPCCTDYGHRPSETRPTGSTRAAACFAVSSNLLLKPRIAIARASSPSKSGRSGSMKLRASGRIPSVSSKTGHRKAGAVGVFPRLPTWR